MNNDLIIENTKQINEIKKEVEQIKEIIGKDIKEIIKMKRKSSSMNMFMDFFNKKIKQLGYHFYLDINN